MLLKIKCFNCGKRNWWTINYLEKRKIKRFMSTCTRCNKPIEKQFKSEEMK